MSKVLVLGATGFLGLATSLAFRAAGYTVYGLVRTEDKAKILLQHEIIPIIGKAQEGATWEKYAVLADIVVDAVADYQDWSTAGNIFKTLEPISKADPTKTIIFTSGCWLYGNTNGKSFTEKDEIHPVELVAARAGIEQQYLKIGAIVTRPSLIYGKTGSLTADWFKTASSDKPQTFGTAADDVPVVHVDDCAQAYVKLAQHSTSTRGQIWNINSYNENRAAIFQAIFNYLGTKKEVHYAQGTDPFTKALSLSQRTDSSKLRQVTGWNPKFASVSDGVATYYQSWKSFQK